MALIFNNTTIKGVNFNGTTVKKVIYNGETVFTADNEIYKDGVLADGVSLSTFSNYTGGGDVYTGNNVLRFSHSQTSFTSGSKTGSITFDFTNISTITITGYVKGWARQADSTTKIGIDSASTQVASGFPYTESAGAFTQTFDVSALTGEHSIVGNIYINNTSGDTTTSAYNFLAISEIMAYS